MVGGAAGGAARVVGGAGEGAARAVGGVVGGGTSAVSGLVAGLAKSVIAAARGDPIGAAEASGQAAADIAAGGEEAVRGVVQGAWRAVRGTLAGVEYFGSGLGSGAGAVAEGVLTPIDSAGRTLFGESAVRGGLVGWVTGGTKPKARGNRQQTTTTCTMAHSVSRRRSRWFRPRRRLRVGQAVGVCED